ncbi:adenosylcobalamin-dependent ribonucleoside-diphosphate reductase [Sorangium sp. So ce281]|uniref:adenosylcobalamin-dependent ribonucleoside-diphosphate reductase n=1 Tax=unclassified Sorangium TaxID=2621164 RepID=UPI003F647E6A
MGLALTDNARRVLEARYLRRGANREILETPEELLRRVARAVARAEGDFAGGRPEPWEEAFFDALAALDFLPNSPTLMNAGAPLGQLSACFVLPVEDSLDGIFDALKHMALIQQSGGGTGFSFSRLRPKDALVASTGGRASGPVSFMRIFDCATDSIKQGGRRRGANMGVLRVDHPDVEAFVDAKLDGQSFSNFNLSVAMTDAFMADASADRPHPLRHPRTGEIVRTVPAHDLFERIARAAHRSGDPALFFLDAANRANPTPALGAFEATNPCGEVPLLPYEACNLGSINLGRMVRRGAGGQAIDWGRLARTARLAVRFLDDVIEVGRRPAPPIDAAVRRTRKIGLGVMGFAELLLRLGIPYGSTAAVSAAEEVMGFIAERALATSEELAVERGPFPAWEQSVFSARGRRVRNATLTSIAPTGTISLVAGTSAGIEPLFGLVFRHTGVLGGQTLVEASPLFEQHARELGVWSDALAAELAAKGSLSAIAGIPRAVVELFRTALEMSPEAHLRIQAAFQKYVDNAVSKTINLPETATADDVAAAYRRAWELGLKGVTVYRYGSKDRQVLELGAQESAAAIEHFARCDPAACKL